MGAFFSTTLEGPNVPGILGVHARGALIHEGNAGFAPAVDHPAGALPHAVAVGDVNGDGRLDLAVANVGIWDTPSMSLVGGSVTVMLRDCVP